jgi:hypothetical protein
MGPPVSRESLRQRTRNRAHRIKDDVTKTPLEVS